ncbi:tripartite tricarboxylate transporter substrate binding protein [Verticiella sediminum]|uniref:Tripartite tricarboxylate transporter substrate binding protein n=1 Tax=Verticiella sediminum TaxID=1247510 RepID=A0A556A7E3_9BURK|nr:tripartite tricarboxylate transporter substrate binding protein [Verticiella sediminum]TSH88805.1 tripartite tricarboxylate transporter substrate binding protein [Verticiella sediminum]
MTSGLLRFIVVAAALLPFPPAFAQYPEHPVRIIVPVAAGGGSDILARSIADKLSAMWEEKVVVDNRPGAGHVLGTAAAAKAAPDGYTILMVGMPHAVNPALQSKLPYRSDDFDPVILLAQAPIVLVASPAAPFTSVAELVQAARKSPGDISFASTSPAGSGHLAGELLKLSAQIDMLHIPYKGSSAALQDVLGGRVPVMFDALVTAAPHIKSGNLRALAVTVGTRAADFPDVPTMQEAGYAGFFVAGYLGLVVPKGTPAAVIDKIGADAASVLRDPEIVDRLHTQGWEILPIGASAEVFGEFLRSEEQKWADVVRAAKITVE